MKQLSNVLFIPKLCANILSLGRLDEEGCQMVMYGGRLTICDWGALLAEVHQTEGRLYLLKLNVIDHCLIAQGEENLSWLWHSHFGHLNFHSLWEMSSKHLVEGLPLIKVPDHVCHSCLIGKHHHTLFPKSSTFRMSKPLELVYVDIYGPISPPTLGGSQYFLLIVDDFSRLMWVAMLKHKSEAFSTFKKFKSLAEAKKNTKLKCLQTGKGREFNSIEFNAFCVSQGITQ